ncbi:MAG: ribosome small subunit-dependent GTPase A [Planctomycetota bacterium]|nr:MAG: ribosome small subunit-dependent GTPase A [Planctomycetota bacterium]
MAAMAGASDRRGRKRGKKVRVDFRRNRSVRRRIRDWKKILDERGEEELDAERSEQVGGKGALSRRRTITLYESEEEIPADLRPAVVVAVRGLYVDVDDGERVVPCTVRRVLRSLLIRERHPVTVGDRVRFRMEEEGQDAEGVIEVVEGRTSRLCRFDGRRIQTIVANVDQTIIVASVDQPPLKPHLIDRYIVASLAGEITPVVCINKVDLDRDGNVNDVTERYERLGYRVLRTSATTGEGIDALREMLKDRSSVIAGQSGVGKSSLLNAVQPGLRLRVGDINEQLNKGRHTTTTATLLRLDMGGYVVDTPGVRSFDVRMIDPHRLEAYFVDFLDHIPHCKFPDCTHRHEIDGAVKRAVEEGAIHPDRYESYVRLFEEAETT